MSLVPEIPLLRRELVGLLRTRKAFWIVVVTVFLSSLIPLITWPGARTAAVTGFENIWTFLLFFLTQLTTALVIVPAVTAGAIAGERERGTYDLLHGTLLSPFAIVLGKVLTSIGYVAILLFCVSPAVFVLHLLGGMSFDSIIQCYAVLFAAMVTACLICLAQSAKCRTTAQAAVRGVLWVVFWNVGMLLLLWLAAALLSEAFSIRAASWLSQAFLVLAFGLSPYPSVSWILFSNTLGAGARGAPWPVSAEPWVIYLGFAGALGLWHFLVLLRRVRRAETASRRRERRALKASRRTGARRRSLFTRVLISLGDDGLPVLLNPVLLKEVRSEFFGRLWYRRACFWFPLLIFVCISAVPNSPDEKLLAVSVVALFLLVILIPAMAASAFPREVEQGNLDFLRGTSLTLGEILAGKFLASLYSVWGLLAAAAWVLLISPAFARVGEPQAARFAGSIAILSISTLFVAAVAAVASTLSRRTLTALVLAYGSLLALFLFWPLLLAFGGHGAFTVLVATSPFAVLFGVLEGSLRDDAPGALVVFFVLYTGGVLLLWLVSWGCIENRYGRD